MTRSESRTSAQEAELCAPPMQSIRSSQTADSINRFNLIQSTIPTAVSLRGGRGISLTGKFQHYKTTMNSNRIIKTNYQRFPQRDYKQSRRTNKKCLSSTRSQYIAPTTTASDHGHRYHCLSPTTLIQGGSRTLSARDKTFLPPHFIYPFFTANSLLWA